MWYTSDKYCEYKKNRWNLILYFHCFEVKRNDETPWFNCCLSRNYFTKDQTDLCEYKPFSALHVLNTPGDGAVGLALNLRQGLCVWVKTRAIWPLTSRTRSGLRWQRTRPSGVMFHSWLSLPRSGETQSRLPAITTLPVVPRQQSSTSWRQRGHGG